MRFEIFWSVSGKPHNKTVYADDFELLRADMAALIGITGIEFAECYGFRGPDSRFDPVAILSGLTTKFFSYKKINIAA